MADEALLDIDEAEHFFVRKIPPRDEEAAAPGPLQVWLQQFVLSKKLINITGWCLLTELCAHSGLKERLTMSSTFIDAMDYVH